MAEIITAATFRERLRPEDQDPALLDFLESINFTAASEDGESWTIDWSHMGVAHMDCRGGDFLQVWRRFMNTLREFRCNGQPIVTFSPTAFARLTGETLPT